MDTEEQGETIKISVESLVLLATGSGRAELLHAAARRIQAGENLPASVQIELLVLLAERILAPRRAPSKASLEREAKAHAAVARGAR